MVDDSQHFHEPHEYLPMEGSQLLPYGHYRIANSKWIPSTGIEVQYTVGAYEVQYLEPRSYSQPPLRQVSCPMGFRN